MAEKVQVESHRALGNSLQENDCLWERTCYKTRENKENGHLLPVEEDDKTNYQSVPFKKQTTRQYGFQEVLNEGMLQVEQAFQIDSLKVP